HPYDMQHITLKLSFDWQQEMVFGEATLHLRAFNNGLKEIELDAANFNVEWVKLANGNNSKTLQFNVTPEKLLITFDRSYKADEEVAFTIKYSATPKHGLHF